MQIVQEQWSLEHKPFGSTQNLLNIFGPLAGYLSQAVVQSLDINKPNTYNMWTPTSHLCTCSPSLNTIVSSSHAHAADNAEMVEMQMLGETNSISAGERAELENSNDMLRTTKICIGPNNMSLHKIQAIWAVPKQATKVGMCALAFVHRFRCCAAACIPI